MRRFFTQAKNIENTLVLTGGEFVHLKNVLRLKVGDEIVVFNGDGFDYFCKIKTIEDESATLNVLKKEKSEKTPKNKITLFQGVLKQDKFEYLIQKMAELGVSKIIPFESSFTVSKMKAKKLERYKKICVSASKQCGRSDMLEVGEGLTLKQLSKTLEKFDEVVFAYERENKFKLENLNLQKTEGKNIAVIVGSEGGFSEKEAQMLVEAGAKSVSLGKRILRAETAPVMLVGIIMFLLGEF